MKLRAARVVVVFLSLALSLTPLTLAQTSTETASALPRLVRFGGTVKDLNSNALTGVVGITFALYSEQTGGSPLWLETQNVTADNNGHYAVLLGSTKPEGLPAELFTSEQARWVGVQVSGQAEQPRVLLVSAPYALKAGDAETIGGLPPSAFVLAVPAIIGSAGAGSPAASTAESVSPATTSDVTTTGGTVNTIPLFSTATNIQNSILTQTAATAVNVSGKLNLPATAAATKTTGADSRPLDFVASSFSSTSSTALNQTFQWQAEPAANDTTAPSGTLNLLYGLGATTPSETGLKLSSKGLFTFATGQTFPGTGDGSVTSVATGLGLKGGPITKAGTLTIDTTVVPQLGTANTFTGNQTVNGNLSATGVVTGSSYQIGSSLFAFGSAASGNAFLGYAGSPAANSAVSADIGVGYETLQNDTGGGNTAVGWYALPSNTTGFNNTGVGGASLLRITTGSSNTAVGSAAGSTVDGSNLTGNLNTALGEGASFGTGSLTNATAIGAQAVVNESNAMVLGSVYSTSGINGYVAPTNVGIGTTAPISVLDVEGYAPEVLGPTITITNQGGGTGATTSIDFNSYTPSTTGTYNPAARIASVDAGGFSDTLRFRSNIPGKANNGLRTNLIILSTGLVGIGTETPDNALSVNGGADKVGGGSWGTFSDGRLKNLNGSFNSGLRQVLKIQPIRYRYKPDNAMGIRDRDEHIGVVAQDVQKVIPEAVTENSRGYLLVNNDPIIWSMVNAIKEQQQEIKQQQELLRAQAAAVRSLKVEVREARETLRKVKVQVAASQVTVVAAAK